MSRIYDWNAPATLAYWPGQAAERTYPTLTEAIREAHAEAGRNPWILTESGEVIHSREIAALRFEAVPEPRGAGTPCQSKDGLVRPAYYGWRFG